ncbi:hypothetical protein BGY98DRAFT_963575 [Russula aff. rugulosa BPL654]|nr:hypothetical protein BGY98DRAFT_963575 [Russula aff. rugulosa BPL654]
MIWGICPDPCCGPINCVFPEHSTPSCSVPELPNGAFTCTDGFTASYDSNPPACVCTAPSVVCNVVCQQSVNKRRWVGNGSCSERGPTWAACGVYGAGPAHGICTVGGCTISLTPCFRNGEDRSALPGVADIAVCTSSRARRP